MWRKWRCPSWSQNHERPKTSPSWMFRRRQAPCHQLWPGEQKEGCRQWDRGSPVLGLHQHRELRQACRRMNWLQPLWKWRSVSSKSPLEVVVTLVNTNAFEILPRRWDYRCLGIVSLHRQSRSQLRRSHWHCSVRSSRWLSRSVTGSELCWCHGAHQWQGRETCGL